MQAHKPAMINNILTQLQQHYGHLLKRPQNINTYQQYHALLVEHAKRYCTKVPQCQHCPLNKRYQKNIE